MSKGEEQGVDRLDDFLKQYVDAPELRAAWKVDGAPTALRKNFKSG